MGALPNAVVKRLLAQHGGGLRVSGTALEGGGRGRRLHLTVGGRSEFVSDRRQAQDRDG